MPYLLSGIPQPYTAADTNAYVSAIGSAERRAGTGLGSAVIESSTGAVCGAAELRLPTPDRPWADIGHWIGANARGRGFAAEATRLLAEWGFAHGVHRIELRTDVQNVASQQSALSAGFRPEGVMTGQLRRPDGTFADEQRYARTNPKLRWPIRG
jgi:RimJ/RimL family protein N-acetyltransferase